MVLRRESPGCDLEHASVVARGPLGETSHTCTSTRVVGASRCVLCLQEVRLNVDVLKIELATLGCDWSLSLTSHRDPHTGAPAGMVVLVRKSAFLAGVQVQSEELVTGRSMATHSKKGKAMMTTGLLHNSGMALVALNAASRHSWELTRVAQESPMLRTALFMGDFNRHAPGESAWRSGAGCGQHKAGLAALRRVVVEMVEPFQVQTTASA